MEIWKIIPIIYAIAAAVLFFKTAAKPKLFWPFSITIAAGAVGLILIPHSPYCVPLVDEFLLAAVVAGALAALFSGTVKIVKSPKTLPAKIHWVLFFLFIFYMLAQSGRGLFLWHDPLLWRWIFYYLLIAALAFLTSNTDLPAPPSKSFLRIILWSSLAYLAVYLCHGLYTQYVAGISPFSLNIQGVQWAGSGYALFAAVVALPAALLYIRYNPGIGQWLGWAVIILEMIAAFFYDSRAVLLAFAAFMPFLITVLDWHKTMGALALLLGAFVFFHWHDMAVFLTSIFQSLTFSYSGDAGRWTIIAAAIMAITQNIWVFLFGYGIHSHHYVLGEFMQRVGHPTITSAVDYSQTTLPGSELVYNYVGEVPDYVRVTGFGGLLTDIGFLGVLLMILIIVAVFLRILFLKNAPGRILALVSLLLAAMWMLFSKIEDIVLLWFMLMPSGITLLLASVLPPDADANRQKK